MTYESNYLAHHGIRGQKWGLRRYQNEDGTLTELGKKHYGSDFTKYTRVSRLKRNLRNTQKSIDKMNKYRFKATLKVNKIKKRNPDPSDKKVKKINKLNNKVDAYNKRIESAEDFGKAIMNKAFAEGTTRRLRKYSKWFDNKAKSMLFKDLARENVKTKAARTIGSAKRGGFFSSLLNTFSDSSNSSRSSTNDDLLKNLESLRSLTSQSSSTAMNYVNRMNDMQRSVASRSGIDLDNLFRRK